MIDIPSKCRFDLMLTTLRFIQDGKMPSDLGERIGEHERHGHFMFQNAKILGFAEGASSKMHLTSEGQAYLSGSEERRTIILTRAILNSRVLLALLRERGSFAGVRNMTVTEIAEFLLGCTTVSRVNGRCIKDTTARRRGSSVKGWLEWVEDNAPLGLVETEVQRILSGENV